MSKNSIAKSNFKSRIGSHIMKFFRLPIAFLYSLAVLVQSCGCIVNAMAPEMEMAIGSNPCHQMMMDTSADESEENMPMACCVDGEKHSDSYANPPHVEEKVVSITAVIPYTAAFIEPVIVEQARPNIAPNAPPDEGLGHFQKNVRLRL